PPLSAFNTLPQAYIWIDMVRNGTFGPNLLPGGIFEDPEALTSGDWVERCHPVDGVSAKVSLGLLDRQKDDKRAPAGSVGALRLRAGPGAGLSVAARPPSLDFPAVEVRSPAVKVKAQELVRISVWVRQPRLLPLGTGGVIVRPSLGGEALEYRNWLPMID